MPPILAKYVNQATAVFRARAEEITSRLVPVPALEHVSEVCSLSGDEECKKRICVSNINEEGGKRYDAEGYAR